MKLLCIIFVLGCLADIEHQICGWEIGCDDVTSIDSSNDSDCSSGCFCTDGIVLEEGVCIHPDNCGSKQSSIPYTINFFEGPCK